MLSLYRYPSGDVLILVETEAGHRRLEEDSGWLTCFAPSARIVQQRYWVLVHRVCTKDMDTCNQGNIVKTLQKENRVLHPELKLVGAHWPKSACSKTRSSLILELADVWAANTLIDKGFLVGLQFHTCNAFHQALRLTQCFHCQQYSHVAKQCKARVCCAHCAGAHDTKACKVQQRQKCAVCREAHKAWSSECRARAGALQRIRQLRDVLPLCFVVQTSTEPRKPTQPQPALSVDMEAEPMELGTPPPQHSLVVGEKQPRAPTVALPQPTAKKGQPRRQLQGQTTLDATVRGRGAEGRGETGAE